METKGEVPVHLKWAETLSRFLDSQFKIPGTNFRFGLDPILGMIPGIGDFGTMAVSLTLLLAITKRGVSQKVIVLMSLNILLDTLIGSIPLVGSIFDFYFKSNNRNIELLKKHYVEGKYQGSGKGIIFLVILIVLVISIAILIGIYFLIKYILSLF